MKKSTQLGAASVSERFSRGFYRRSLTVAARERLFQRAAKITLFFTFWLIFLSAVPALAQEQKKGLVVQLEPIALIPRSGGPIPIEWRFRWQGKGILEGHLEFRIFDGNRLRGAYRTDDLALTDVEQRFRQLIPPFEVEDQFNQARVDMEFVGKNERIRLSPGIVRLPPRHQCILSLATCAAWDISISAETLEIERALRLEQFDPERNNPDQKPGDRPLMTAGTHFAPRLMPADALSYCSFDLVVLVGDGFAALRETQLKVIQSWVEAGGSLLVVVSGALQPYHTAFLNDLSAASAAPPFVLDQNGRLEKTLASSKDLPRFLHTGLGRVVIASGESKLDFGSADWKNIVLFLWKVRSSQMPVLRDRGDWGAALPKSESDPVKRYKQAHKRYEQGYDSLRFRREPPQTILEPPLAIPEHPSAWLADRLLPESVRILPLSIMALILVLYTAAVGPLDYLLLGRLRLRKLTWILFPAVTLAFTGFTMWLANRSMHAGNARRSAVVLDVVEGNRIARANQFELLFMNAADTVTTEVKRGLWVPLSSEGIALPDREPGGPGEYQKPRELVLPPHSAGWIPTSYVVSQVLPQWTPQLNRLLTIAPSPEIYPASLDWDSIRAGDLATESGLSQLQQKARAAFGSGARVYLFHQDQVRVFQGSRHVTLQAGALGTRSEETFLGRTARIGLFSIVSHVAPGGSPALSDLPILDETDARQWMVVVVVPKGEEDVWIYRRLYRSDA